MDVCFLLSAVAMTRRIPARMAAKEATMGFGRSEGPSMDNKMTSTPSFTAARMADIRVHERLEDGDMRLRSHAERVADVGAND